MSEPLTPERYLGLLKDLGSVAAVARHLGRNERTLRRWVKEHISASETSRVEACGPSDLLNHLVKKPRTLDELCNLMDKGPATVRAWLSSLAEQGYNIQDTGGVWSMEKTVIPAEARVDHTTTSSRLTIGVVSDTHLGSKCQQLTYLNRFYDLCVDLGIRDIYHTGDLLAGVNVYRGQRADLFLHTEDDQVTYAVEHYPRRPGVRTHLIGGNHDLVFIKGGGADPLKMVALQRDDINYLGPFSAWVRLTELCQVYMLHPDKGGSYALSYRLQKLVESFEGGRKPNVCLVGHWHTRCYIMPRNVHAMSCACFESQTDFERRNMLQPQVGGTMLTLDFGDDGAAQRFVPEFVSYLVPIDHDY